MNNLIRILKRAPRTHDEYAWQVHVRLGAMALAALAIFLLMRFWYIAVIAAIIAFVVRLLVKRVRR
jgi:hypothetical protein